jgi:hypothetical protein
MAALQHFRPARWMSASAQETVLMSEGFWQKDEDHR